MRESVFLRLDTLSEHDRVCHLYGDDVERLEVGTNFILHGIRNREKCLYVSDRAAPKEFIYRLRGSGVDVSKAVAQKDFEEVTTTAKQMDGADELGSFVELLGSRVEDALKNGRRVRVLRSRVTLPYSHSHLLHGEALLSKFCMERPVILMCQYDLGRVSSQDTLSLLRAYPTVVLENVAYQSTFYSPPDEILSRVEGEYTSYAELTSKEKAILRYIVNGYSNRSIAKELSISVKTVETHRANIMRKLDVNKLVDLVKFAIRNRIV